MSGSEGGNGEFTIRVVKEFREKLLDLTRKNRTLNFRHSDRARTHIRVIDEIPDFLFKTIASGKKMTFKSLPEPVDRPKDEQTQDFRDELEAVRLTDEKYRQDMDALDPDADNSEQERKIERKLRDKVREKLGLPVLPHKEMKIQKYAQALNFEPSYDLPESSGDGTEEKKHTDKYIQALLFPDAMERKLGGIYQKARSALQEMGVNTLYVAFGFLEWTESGSSSLKMFAPLLFIPVTMERKRTTKGYKFSVISTGDDPSINLSLRVNLRREFGIELPEFERNDDDKANEDTPESYWEKVTKSVKDKKGWRIRRFVTIGHFAFSRLVMYEDLDPSKWPPGTSPVDHGVISKLIAGSGGGPVDALVADEYDVDTEEVEAKVPLLITDADSSQFSSIVDVMDGKNLVIKGPPGTGKSQTITNIIGAALDAGKKVLFVAAKMAALDVVHKRLSDAGIGKFCLELHSTKSSKATVMKSLKDRDEMKRPHDPLQLDSRLKEFRNVRSQLTRYAETINTPFGGQGETLQEIVWRAQAADFAARKAEIPDKVYHWAIQNAVSKEISEVEYSRNILLAVEEASKRALDGWESREEHPWHGVRRTGLSPYDQEELLEEVKAWHDAVLEVTEIFAKVEEETGSPRPDTLAETRTAIETLKQAPMVRSQVDYALMLQIASSNSDVLESIRTVADFCERVKAFRIIERELQAVVEDPAQSTDHADDIRNAAERLNALKTSSDKNGVDGTIGGLLEQAKIIENYDEQAARLFKAFGLKSARTAHAVLRAVVAANLLTCTDREALIYRTPEAVDEAYRPIIQKAQQELSKILGEKKELSQRYRYRYEDDHLLLQDHAQIIRSAGYFRRLFGGDYRQAKLAYVALVGPASGKALPQEMAVALEEVSDHLKKARSFLDNAGYQKVAGRHWVGLDTPFETISRASDFAGGVRTKLTDPNFEEEQSLRTFCLETSQERIDDVDMINRRAGYADMRSYLEELIDEGRGDHKLSYLAQTFNEAYSTLTDSGVIAEVQVSTIENVADRLATRAKAIAAIEENEQAKDILGNAFAGLKTDIESIGITTLAAGEVADSGLDAAVQDRILRSGDYAAMLAGISEHVSKLEALVFAENDARQKVSEHGRIEMEKFLRIEDVCAATLRGISKRINFALEHRDILQDWIAFNRALAQAVEAGMQPLLDIYDEVKAPYENMVKAFNCAFHRSVMRSAYEKMPELKKLSGMAQEQARARFRDLDRRILNLYREKLRAQLFRADIPYGNSNGPKKTWTNLSLIRHVCQLQKPRTAIRNLISRAGEAIQAMKPCFMMSPASVAQFLTPGEIEFDLVVIDEASQMKPEEAIGAITRGRQLVVVGDPKQLPPSPFFEKADLSADEEPEEYEDSDMESILDQAIGIFHPIRDLRWHYRSRHESLINFSNRHFYDDRLIVFPSPTPVHPELGVHRVYVDTPAYKGGLNEPEARKIVDIAVDFMHSEAEKPTMERRSLALVTMNIAQRDLVQEMLDRRIAFDNMANEYYAHWGKTLEPMIVKNLENVQGDERDIIMISTVYGPETPGGPVKQRFGPVNGKAGHRRLNVLFTRAKQQVILVTSLRSTDIVVGKHPGVGILKRYLQYAETGRIEVGKNTGRDTESPFEDFVKRRLESHGYDVVPQVGVAGYRIDLAVRHPDNADHFVLGIECDGATYHSAKSARDRDRIREEVITGLGWRLHRIWSLDWFSIQDKEMERLIGRIQTEIKKQPMFSTSESLTLAIEDKVTNVERDRKETTVEEDVEAEGGGVFDEPEDKPGPENICVCIGDTVIFHYVGSPDKSYSFTIVHGEYDINEGTISQRSPIGSALIGSTVGEEVDVVIGQDNKTIVLDEIQKPEKTPADDDKEITNKPEQLLDETNRRDRKETRAQVAVNTADLESNKRHNLWSPRPLPDPRKSHKNDVAKHLKVIIESDGPIRVRRVFRLYSKACGIGRIGREVRSKLNGALYQLLRQRQVEIDEDGASKGQINGTVRIVGMPKVLVRGGDDREFWDIPPSEIAEVMDMKLQNIGAYDPERLYRKILDYYGVGRLTKNIREELERILKNAAS